MKLKIPIIFFIFFVLSGICSLIYQVVWLRLAMASYGVTTPMISIVLSVFMTGLALGSWGAGRLSNELSNKPRLAVRLYALAELLIGSSALAVPYGLKFGRTLVLSWEGCTWGSLGHYIIAGGLVSIVLLPYTICMGATIPLAMFALRRSNDSKRSFSYLYLANVMGATLGTLGAAFILIEILGFKRTLILAGFGNLLLAGGAFVFSRVFKEYVTAVPENGIRVNSKNKTDILVFLFATGLISMGLEVIWMRLFTPFVGTEVYAFASILALYLVATFVGSWVYRNAEFLGLFKPDAALIWAICGLTAFVALVGADPRLTELSGNMRVLIGVVFFSATLGFLTPMLVDRWSEGDGQRAGTAYAINVLGCILGPILAGFILLPKLGERWSIVALGLSCFIFSAVSLIRNGKGRSTVKIWRYSFVSLLLSAVAVLFTRDYESIYLKREVRRDYAATSVAAGEGMGRQLYINGEGITALSPITKIMAHLPLAMMSVPPRNGLVICFGMGTCFRSMHSWGIESTTVELVPSVPRLFPYFYNDAEQILNSPRSHVIIDDGRRFLERTNEVFDVITVDPPPPVPAACSSLLYSKEFYGVAKKRLSSKGVFQQWIPEGDPVAIASFCKSFAESFPYTRFYSSVLGWGIHCLGSMEPLPPAFELENIIKKIPPRAQQDLLEWTPGISVLQLLKCMHEIQYGQIVQPYPSVPALEDDRPVNEYYFLRQQIRNVTMQ
jgi:predicted membrane-bound spermidine synthase